MGVLERGNCKILLAHYIFLDLENNMGNDISY